MTSSWGGKPLSKQANSLAWEALFFMSDTQSGVTSPKEIFKGNTDKDENPSLCKWCWYNMQCTGLATALCKCHPVQGSRLQCAAADAGANKTFFCDPFAVFCYSWEPAQASYKAAADTCARKGGFMVRWVAWPGQHPVSEAWCMVQLLLTPL
jgi:hypothetical protein